MTPPPHDGQKYTCVDAETCREIATDKAGLAIGAHERNFDHGVGKLERRFETAEQHNEDRMNRIENLQADHSKAIEGFIAERGYRRWVIPVVISCLGSSVAGTVVALLVHRLTMGH
jgi:hypothetical protein